MKNKPLKQEIHFLVMDVDGTLTDGKIYMGNNGEVFKAFDIKDGCGIHDIAINSGITPVIITGRNSDIVLNRCKELGITKVFQGVPDKLCQLRKVTPSLAEVAYIGDDINDLPCINAVNNEGGITGCPNDASLEVLKAVDYIAKRNGGNGAVREFIEWLVYEKKN